jgi:ubiquinone/menaquinone biosynthesis C-methylase UbiE
MTEPRLYWEERARRYLAEGAGLRAVCSYGMPGFYNGYIHLTQRLALAPWLRVSPGTRVLDAGCGVGRWSLHLAASGARVTGIDLARPMVEEARRRAERRGLAHHCRFLVADLAHLDLGERFDRILVVTVLQHIVDPERFRAAIGTLAAHVAPDGDLVVLEAAPSRPDVRCDSATFRAREVEEYRAAFADAGLSCITESGVDPVPLKTRLLPFYARLPRLVALAALSAVTALSLPVDALAGRRLARASWHKVLVFRRPRGPM